MTAVHHGTALHRADLGAAGREVLHDLHADFAMGDLAATETDGHLHLIATLKELLRHFRLRENVVLLDGGGQLNLLGFDDPLILPVFAFAPRLFVAVLVIVQQFAHRRFCRGLDFGEVEAAQAPRTLADGDLRVINSNYALQAGTDVVGTPIAYESTEVAYPNIIAVREGDDREELKTLVEVLQGDEIVNFINETYKGAVVPTK